MIRFENRAAFAAALADLPGPDAPALAAARARQASLTKPAGSLGRLEDIAVFMAGWQGRIRPRAERIRAVVFAGNHGVAARGVSAYPPKVTAQMVANFEAGGAAVANAEAEEAARTEMARARAVRRDIDGILMGAGAGAGAAWPGRHESITRSHDARKALQHGPPGVARA